MNRERETETRRKDRREKDPEIYQERDESPRTERQKEGERREGREGR